MCRGCYEEQGSPIAVCETTQQAVDVINEIYRLNNVGGNAHIVVDDWNLEDEHIDFCLDQRNWVFRDASDEQKACEKHALMLLKDMTIDQRFTVLALKEGIIG